MSTYDDNVLKTLHQAVDREASDVHFVPGYPITFRIHGRLEQVGESALTTEEVRAMVEFILPERLIPE